MKKYITTTAIILCILCGIGGCIKEDLLTNNKTGIDENCILFSLQSRKSVKSQLPHNEDKLEYASVFFFDPNDSLLAHYEKNMTIPDDGKIAIPLDAKMNGKQYMVYVIANYDVTTDDLSVSGIDKAVCDLKIGETKLNDLKTLVLTTIFNRNEDGEEASFVMDGQTEISVTLGVAMEETVELERVASRIQLYASFKSFEETKNGKTYTYTPLSSTAKVTLYNAIGRTTFSDNPLYEPQPSDVANPRVRTMQEYEGDADSKKGYYYNELPLYSYANDWSHEANLATYLELSVDWEEEVDNRTEVVRYYYQVPVTTAKKLVRNNAYQIAVDVSISGSETPTEAVTLSGNLEVIPWTEIQFSSDLNRYKYLSVDPQADTLYNVASTQFKYSSSSPIQVEITEVSYIDYSTKENKPVSVANPQGEGFKAYVVGNEIHFDHKINKELQFYPYTITLTVRNEDDGVEPQIIKIIQYPAIYVAAESDTEIQGEGSNNHRFLNGDSSSGEEIFLNPGGSSSGTGTKMSVGTLLSLSESYDKNPNQYTIYVTAFDADDKMDDGRKYMIGDSREETGHGVQYVNALTEYKATRTDLATQNMIAPIYKVASSWGGSKALNWINGGEDIGIKNRCAVYQENGYPAGRWRVPTEAEIEYIVNLSEKKNQIPVLFNTKGTSAGAYYAASGRVWTANGWKDTGYPLFVRCVYDVWYWGDESIKDKSKFVWGDAADGSLKDKDGKPYNE